ncbi:signal peptidase II [Candidatus Uhrbacteria bacterium]|nr:signal peptidase II [Candidatus Uhrbacteria bacterium]
MKSQFLIYLLLIPVALIVFLDEWIKSRALQVFPEDFTLVSPKLFDFAVHKNYGLVFDIPFRLEFVVITSIIIGFLLLQIVCRNFLKRPKITFPVLLILIGAFGNFYDRLAYGFTVDYIIVLGRSAINFSDMIIVLGVLSLLLFTQKNEKPITC